MFSSFSFLSPSVEVVVIVVLVFFPPSLVYYCFLLSPFGCSFHTDWLLPPNPSICFHSWCKYCNFSLLLFMLLHANSLTAVLLKKKIQPSDPCLYSAAAGTEDYGGIETDVGTICPFLLTLWLCVCVCVCVWRWNAVMLLLHKWQDTNRSQMEAVCDFGCGNITYCLSVLYCCGHKKQKQKQR